MRKILEECPACGGRLDVTRLSCATCDTVVEGSFEPCTFCRLAPASVQFLVTFVRNRGNLKEMERELGQSYQALRGRLNSVIRELGFEVDGPLEETDDEASGERSEVLGRLERGEIAAAEATEMLRRLRQGPASAHEEKKR